LRMRKSEKNKIIVGRQASIEYKLSFGNSQNLSYIQVRNPWTG